MDKVALFIAGDERIYFPALVAIESIKKHNGDAFDYFMCFDGTKLSEYMSDTLKSYGINFVDTSLLNKYGILESFQEMKENIWPKDVFYNYALPVYFNELGYKYSCKADYDILCISPYNMGELLPAGKYLSGWGSKLDIHGKAGVPESVINYYVQSGTIESKHVPYMNVGFIAFNNSMYVEHDLLTRFKDYYQYLFLNCPESQLLEQTAFAIMLGSLKGEFVNLPESYNHRVVSSIDTNSDFSFDIKNIHYITRLKPWKAVNTNCVRWSTESGFGSMFAYRNIWLEYAEEVEGFEELCEERKLTTLELIGLQMNVARTYEKKIKSIKA